MQHRPFSTREVFYFFLLQLPFNVTVSVSLCKVSATGSVLRSEIMGSIKLKVVLSGMPELRLGLNDKVLFEITGSE